MICKFLTFIENVSAPLYTGWVIDFDMLFPTSKALFGSNKFLFYDWWSRCALLCITTTTTKLIWPLHWNFCSYFPVNSFAVFHLINSQFKHKWAYLKTVVKLAIKKFSILQQSCSFSIFLFYFILFLPKNAKYLHSQYIQSRLHLQQFSTFITLTDSDCDPERKINVFLDMLPLFSWFIYASERSYHIWSNMHNNRISSWKTGTTLAAQGSASPLQCRH